jgi:hypothetical protein
LAAAKTAGNGSESSHFVILFASRWITEYVIGRRDFFELVFGPRVGVGVMLFGESTIGARELLL